MSTRPFRVLRIIARLNIGGPARHVTILNGALRDRGHQTLLLHGQLAPGEGSLEGLIAVGGLAAQRVRGLGRTIGIWNDLAALGGLLRLVYRFQPDVLHTHTAKAGVLGRIAAAIYNATRTSRRRCLVVHTFHGHVFSGYFSPRASRVVRLVERGMALLTDRIIVLSEQQRAEIVDRFHIADQGKVDVVPLGLDLDPFLSPDAGVSDLRPEFGFGSTDVVFGYVGRLVPIKDLDTMFRGFAAAFQSAPTVRLLIVGDGDLRSHLEHLSNNLSISPAVRFTGWRHDLSALYRTIDVGILSSVNEGTPVALIEAMAAGRPVLATQVGGVGDVVSPEVTGLLVQPGDPQALASGILQLARNPELRRRMGEAARADVGSRYGRARLVQDIEHLYCVGVAAKRGGLISADTEPLP